MWKNLEPNIYRQRLVVEGKYTLDIDATKLVTFLNELSKLAEMTIVFGPKVMNLAENINPIHEGYEGILIWAESGAQIYTWNKFKFFSLDIYTCKNFDVPSVLAYIKEYFKTDELVWKELIPDEQN